MTAARPGVVERVLGRLADHEGSIREVDPLELTSEQRSRSHLRGYTKAGRELLVSLERGQELEDGDVLAVDDGVAVVVAAAAEDVLEVLPRSPREWGVAAYQLGNMHRSVRFNAEGFLTPYEPSSEDLLRSLGVRHRRLQRAFTGERVTQSGGVHRHQHDDQGHDHGRHG